MRYDLKGGISVADVQGLLASAGYYKAAVDNDAGGKTWAAVEIIERQPPKGRKSWTAQRRLIAAAQSVLAAQGFEPGFVDGYFGHNSLEALTAWRSAVVGADASVPRPAPSYIRAHPAQLAFPRQSDLKAFYGPAGGAACTRGRVVLPFPFVIAWDQSERITSFACHEKVADAFTGWLSDAAKHYGETQFRALGLDQYGGCYNYRKMRGGTALSTHAYGIAVDIDPTRNQLRWDHKRAQFARAEYVAFLTLAIQHGITPAGWAWDGDWMHFQAARL